MTRDEQLFELLRSVGSKSEPVPVKSSSPAPFSKKNLFVHHDTHPIVFDLVLLDRYKTDWFGWEAETLWREIMRDFRAPSISDLSKTKIQAIRTLHISDWPWNKWEVFCWMAQALNNVFPDFHVLQQPSLSQLLVAVDIMQQVRDKEPFGQEVQSFMAASIMSDGVVVAPDIVSFCQDEIEQYLKDKKMESALDLAGPVKNRVAEAKNSTAMSLTETPVDIQAAKILLAQAYLDLQRRKLKTQLEVLTP